MGLPTKSSSKPHSLYTNALRHILKEMSLSLILLHLIFHSKKWQAISSTFMRIANSPQMKPGGLLPAAAALLATRLYNRGRCDKEIYFT